MNRPEHITKILKTIQTNYSADGRADLTAYVSDLESKQVIMLTDKAQAPQTIHKPSPIWAIRRRIQLERLRRRRLDQKLHKNS